MLIDSSCVNVKSKQILKLNFFELPEELINTRENVRDFIFGSANVWEKEKIRKTFFVDPVFIGLVEYKGHKFTDDTHYI